jgi:hypothetical protein
MGDPPHHAAPFPGLKPGANPTEVPPGLGLVIPSLSRNLVLLHREGTETRFLHCGRNDGEGGRNDVLSLGEASARLAPCFSMGTRAGQHPQALVTTHA